MNLEKLDLLEKRLEKFVESFASLKRENEALKAKCEGYETRLKGLEADSTTSDRRKEEMRNCIERINAVIDKLEQLQDGEAESAE